MTKIIGLCLTSAIALVMAAPSAHAFNPQPDPPGKSIHVGQKVNPATKQFSNSKSGPSWGNQKVGLKEFSKQRNLAR